MGIRCGIFEAVEPLLPSVFLRQIVQAIFVQTTDNIRRNGQPPKI
jgi:hypothetical protein